tara:strand:- start:4064 stop:4867 length:804 start_codon:yes stop_codon:yes gene_type:complete
MKNNPFEKYGVEYLSPSSINKFRKDPAKWLVNIAGYKDALYSPAISFGIAVEKGITVGCMTSAPIYECVNHALREYDTIYEKMVDDEFTDYDFDKCREKQMQLGSVLEKIIPLYRKFGRPVSVQERVELFVDLPIPIIGFIDMLYEDSVRDIKTTGIMPKLRQDYNFQLALYSTAKSVPPFIDAVYVTKTKTELHTLPIDNVDYWFGELVSIGHKMMRLLSFSSDVKEVAHMSCLCPDISNEDFFRQWGPNEILGAKEIFDIKEIEK